MSYAIHLKCRECERTYPLEPLAACEECWAPLEVVYDYGKLWADLRREDLASRPPTMWRYKELLPLAREPYVGHQTGFTPLVAGATPGGGAGASRTLCEKRFRQSPHALLQGPRGGGGALQGARVWI